MAQAFQNFGSRVTVVDLAPSILIRGDGTGLGHRAIDIGSGQEAG